MHVNIQAVTPSTMHLVEPGASVEMFWETENRNDIEQMTRDDLVFNKQIWMQNTHLTWGICGYTAFVDNGDATANPVPAATVFFAPASYLPGTGKMPTAPVSPDAIVLSTVHVSDAYMGLYLEHQLIDTVITEATRRGVKAIEAFARAEEFDDSIVQRALGLHSKLDQGEQTVDAKNATPNDQGLPDVASAERTEEAEGATATSLVRDAGKGQEQISSTSSPQVLTPLEELKFIPEAYRGWDSESGLDRAADSADASGHAASRQENGAAQDYLERAPLLSEDILEEEGFSIIAHHPKYPRYRRELPEATSLFARFNKAEHQELNGPEEIHTVLGGEGSFRGLLQAEHATNTKDPGCPS